VSDLPHEPGQRASAPERWRDRVLVALFAVGLAFPLFASLVGLGDRGAGSEKRVLRPLPPLAPDEELREAVAAEGGGALAAWVRSIRAWPKQYEAYYDDHFPFRNRLIQLHHALFYLGLGVSPRPDVVRGKDGWLFTNASDQEQAALDQVRGLHPFTEDQLREWQRFLEDCRDWFADRGIPYYLTIAPSKPSIHPEYLPDWFEARDAVTRLDQLRDWLADTPRRDGRPGVELIDLRPALLAAKERYAPLYKRTDTHWNGLGALIASGAIVDALRERFPSLPPLGPDQYEIRRMPAAGGDLASVLSLVDQLEDEAVGLAAREELELVREMEGMVAVRIPSTAAGYEANLDVERQFPFRLVQPGSDLPRLLMFRDSYASTLVPFLSRAFSSAAYYWQYRIHDPAIMATERPDVVVQEIGERVLMRNVGLPRNEPFLVRDGERMRAFRDAELVVARAEPESGEARLELPLEALPRDRGILVRIAGDFVEGGRVRARVFPPVAGHAGWPLGEREVLAWKDVVYFDAERSQPQRTLVVELETPRARDVTVEVRAKPRATPRD